MEWLAAVPLYHLANAYDRSNAPDSAIVAYERAVTKPGLFKLMEAGLLPAAHKRLGELYETLNEFDSAVRHYQTFVNLWDNADPDLQSQVDDVVGRIDRLAVGR